MTEERRRRSTRLSIAIPIFISGTNTLGKAFREKAHTLVVNKHGAKIATAQRLAAGAEVLIENPAMGFTAKAVVIPVVADPLGIDPTSGPGTPPEVAVQLYEARNIWGIEFPPGDWE